MIKIDNIRFTKGYQGSDLVGAKIFSPADVTTGWSGSDILTADASNKILGSASIAKTGSGTDWFSYNAAPFNTTVSEADGVAKFWLFVSDATQFAAAEAYVFSSPGQSRNGCIPLASRPPEDSEWLESRDPAFARRSQNRHSQPRGH